MRADLYLKTKGYYKSRSAAADALEKGEVLIDGKPVKPSKDISKEAVVTVKEVREFVSRGGYKLKRAIEYFGLQIADKTFADIGASTGGFTDCLLQNGAKKVYAIDVGENQLDESLNNDGRVKVLDNLNARYLSVENLGELADGVVTDVSFISLTLILPSALKILKEGGEVIALIKPQFECTKADLNKNGIINDKKVRLGAIGKIYDFAIEIGFSVKGLTNSPIIVGKNKEYLIYLVKEKTFSPTLAELLKNIE